MVKVGDLMCLGNKRQEFINQYFICRFNATEAARQAGYKNPNKYGPKLLHEPEVEAEIKRRMKERTLEADQVLFLLTGQATANAADFIDEHGIVDFEYIKESGVQVEEINHYKGRSGFKLPSTQQALNLLGKYHKLFTEKSEVEVSGAIEQTHKIELGDLTDDQLAKLEQLVASITS